MLQNAHGPLGYVHDYIGSVQSQFWGSAHIHMLAYVKTAPVLDVNTDSELVSLIENSCVSLPDLPGIALTEEDRNLPGKLQQHKHKATCFKRN